MGRVKGKETELRIGTKGKGKRDFQKVSKKRIQDSGEPPFEKTQKRSLTFRKQKNHISRKGKLP